MSTISHLPNGKYKASFENKRGNIKRTKRTFMTRIAAREWLDSMEKKATLTFVLGSGYESVVEKMLAAAEAHKRIPKDGEWYAAEEWCKLGTREQLAVLFVKYRGRCHHCEVRVFIGDRGDYGATRDHIWPVIAGGGDVLDNLVLSCRRCNRKKGSYINFNTTKSL